MVFCVVFLSSKANVFCLFVFPFAKIFVCFVCMCVNCFLRTNKFGRVVEEFYNSFSKMCVSASNKTTFLTFLSLGKFLDNNSENDLGFNLFNFFLTFSS